MPAKAMSDAEWAAFIAPFDAKPGQIWVCPACGKTSRNKYSMGDTSCTTWAVLCYETPDKDGLFQVVPESA